MNKMTLKNDLKIPELDILKYDYVRVDKKWRYQNINSPFYRLYFVIDGLGEVKINDSWTKLKCGYVYLIPSNQSFSCRCDSFLCKLYFHLNVRLYHGVDIFSSNEIMSVRYEKSDLERLLLCVECPNPKNSTLAGGILLEYVSQFIDEKLHLDDQMMIYSDILTDIEKKISANLKINDIVLGNCYEVSRKFKSYTGVTLKKYCQNILIQRIKELLLTTDLSIKQIAEKYQFCDQYYLTRFFKKMQGISPSEYRNINKF